MRCPRYAMAQLHEIKSPDHPAAGPAALTDGVERLQQLILAWARGAALLRSE